jgi:D-alanyl-lipoteichoic acid acyltransferase DltB (MBOAT superfamily)
MLFNSLDFAVFLPLVFIIYWAIPRHCVRLRNLFLVASSYLFYSFWDWRFLVLIVGSTVMDYVLGLAIDRQDNQTKRRTLLWISIVVNLGFLGFFKYFNFFADNFREVFSLFGYKINALTLDIILPVGISFYTFQTLSYTIDIYRRQFAPTRDFVAFSAFVAFFPQLAAGPIERAGNFLPQFLSPRTFDPSRAVDGMRQMLWGLFKKVVIADNCAALVNQIFENSASQSGSTLAVGVVLFAFQIYGDFSGYSDMALGMSRLFGFSLRQNFAYPLFSRDVAEFWRRWHMSLSTWFRDYLYIPLGGSRGGRWMRIRNTFVIFLVSGFWHGADWTFVVWGGLNAALFLPLLLTSRNRTNLDTVAEGRILPSPREFFAMAATFGLLGFIWVFFRAENMSHALSYLGGIFSPSLFSLPTIRPDKVLAAMLVLFFVVEWFGRTELHALEKLGTRWPRVLRWGVYLAIVFMIVWFGGKQQDFIYFQF